MNELPDHSAWQRAADDLTPEPPVHRPLASGDLATSWELDEFFEALGPVMRLPPKEDTKRAEPVKATEKKPKRADRSRKLVLTAVLLLTLAAFQAPIVRAISRDRPVPDDFIGTWETTSRRYADRGFTITSDTLRLRLGLRRVAVYPISGVRITETGDSVVYAVRYKDGTATLEMDLRMDIDSTLRLANLPGVFWRKAGS